MTAAQRHETAAVLRLWAQHCFDHNAYWFDASWDAGSKSDSASQWAALFSDSGGLAVYRGATAAMALLFAAEAVDQGTQWPESTETDRELARLRNTVDSLNTSLINMQRRAERAEAEIERLQGHVRRSADDLLSWGDPW
jgi:septal ring factor EnvC (AmiA/AmiB activator)